MTDPLAYLFGLEQFGIKFGLENMTRLLDGLGHPERTFRSIHIAGTNGKGSVAAMVDAALRAAGHRAARYTSPHLVDLTERFVIDGRPVSADALVALVSELRDLIEALQASGALLAHPTFFEVTTAAAFELFRRAGVDIATIEVGLGGRLDATNVIAPAASAITTIAFDHEQYLGRSLGAIAAEKAGIIKPHVPVVVGDLGPEPAAVVERIARERCAELIRSTDGIVLTRSRSTIRLRTPAWDYGEIRLALAGVHQVANAIVAVRLLELLAERGVVVPPQAIVDGLTDVFWPGRLDCRRLPDGREALLDAAHNPAGAAALAAYLGESGEKRPLVIAIMRDKDGRAMLEALLPFVSALVVTRASTSRSADPEALATTARELASDLPVAVEARPEDALAAAWRLAPRIVVAGSIFLLGDVMKVVGG